MRSSPTSNRSHNKRVVQATREGARHGSVASQLAVDYSVYRRSISSWELEACVLSGTHAIVRMTIHAMVVQNKIVLDEAIREERDFEYDYFGFKTLEKSYLLRCAMQ